VVVVAAATVVAVLAARFAPAPTGRGERGDAGPPAAGPAVREAPYRDRSSDYRGPALDTVSGRDPPPHIRYRPATERPALAAFRIVGMDGAGRPLRPTGTVRPAGPVDRLPGTAIEVEVGAARRDALTRLPVPTGHVVELASVTVDGRPVELEYTPADEPVIRSPGSASSVLRYRTVPARMPARASPSWPALPVALAERIAGLDSGSPEERVLAVVQVVESLLATRLDAATYDALRLARVRGDPLLASALRAGGGDCDVVNTALASALTSVGVPARLAVGWVGADGRPMPGNHAWVEADLGGGRWVVADASTAVPAAAAAEIAHSDPAPSFGDPGAGRHASAGGWRWLVPGAAVAIAACLLALVLGRRFRRTLTPGVDPDPGPLVESLLRGGAAWLAIGWARRRPLVAEIGGRRRSLDELERAAARGRLFAAGGGGPHAERVQSAGGVVLDGRTRAGRAAMLALGGVDLDRWRRATASAERGALARAVEAGLQSSGIDVEILEASDLAAEVEALVLPGVRRATVAVGAQAGGWTAARRRLRERPAEAVLRGADLVCQSLPHDPRHLRRALAALARSAVLEVVGGDR
jgi:hypothetical protein